MGKKWKQGQTLFSWDPKLLWTVTAATKLKGSFLLEEKKSQIYTAYYKAEISLCQQRSV